MENSEIDVIYFKHSVNWNAILRHDEMLIQIVTTALWRYDTIEEDWKK